MKSSANVAEAFESTLSQISISGFAIIPDVISPTDAKTVRALLDDSTIKHSRAGARHLLGHKFVEGVANDTRMLEIARVVLGSEASPFRATLFDKSERANWLVTWHQDTALPLQERQDLAGWGPWSVKDGIHYAHAPAAVLEQVLALRLHLDDSTPTNGPLRILPGTHCLGVLTEETIHDIAASTREVECTVTAGGVIAMCPLVVHASSKCAVPVRRRVLHIEYAASPKIAHPLELAFA